MNTLRPTILTIALGALALTAACRDPGDGLARPADYIRGTVATRLVIELDTVAAEAPRAGVAQALTAGLAPLLDKPDGIVVEVDQTDLAPKTRDGVWTFAELRTLADATFDPSRPQGTISMQTLWLDGRYEQPGVLGVAWGNAHVAIFSDFLDDTCTRLLPGLTEVLCAASEQAIWTHEIGHVLGLVNNGVPMIEDHQDEENGAHDDDDGCIMYWAYEGERLITLLREAMMEGDDTDLGFDAKCRADLDAVRNRTP